MEKILKNVGRKQENEKSAGFQHLLFLLFPRIFSFLSKTIDLQSAYASDLGRSTLTLTLYHTSPGFSMCAVHIF